MYEYLSMITNTKKVTQYENNALIHQADLLLIHVHCVGGGDHHLMLGDRYTLAFHY